MAIRLALLSICYATLSTLVGCQQPSMISALPAPNFDAPRIAALPAPQPVRKPDFTSAQRTVRNADGPREWQPAARARPWKWIVIHHSATAVGGARRFDQMHKDKGWDELGYHFVIGNGSDTKDGQIEVGPRWPKQKWGAHAKTPDNQFNDFGIGICLVGNFETGRPTTAQLRSTARLVAYLMRTYNIPPDRILGHQDTGRATDCPGRLLSISNIRMQATRMLADADLPPTEALARGELLIDATK